MLCGWPQLRHCQAHVFDLDLICILWLMGIYQWLLGRHEQEQLSLNSCLFAVLHRSFGSFVLLGLVPCPLTGDTTALSTVAARCQARPSLVPSTLASWPASGQGSQRLTRRCAGCSRIRCWPREMPSCSARRACRSSSARSLLQARGVRHCRPALQRRSMQAGMGRYMPGHQRGHWQVSHQFLRFEVFKER